MNTLTLQAFADEFLKIAARTPEEDKAFSAVMARQRELEQLSASGKLSAAEKAEHRHNTTRLTHYLRKGRDDNHVIPPWAVDPKGADPADVHTARGTRTAGPPPPSGAQGAYTAEERSNAAAYEATQRQRQRRSSGYDPPHGGGYSGYDPRTYQKELRSRIRKNVGTLAGSVGGYVAGDLLKQRLETNKDGSKATGVRNFVATVSPYAGAVGGAFAGRAAGNRWGA